MRQDRELDASARPYPGAMFVDGTLEQDGEANPTAALRRAYGPVLGGEPKLYRKNASNDTIRFAERGRRRSLSVPATRLVPDQRKHPHRQGGRGDPRPRPRHARHPRGGRMTALTHADTRATGDASMTRMFRR